MDLVAQQVEDKFTAFELDRDPTRVLEALEAIEATGGEASAADLVARQRALSSWFLFLSALDRHIDRQWNPADLPVKGAPPPLVHGVVHPSGEVDPATIPDAGERLEYERALKASRDFGERYRTQLELRRIDERAMRDLERWLAGRYSKSEQDTRELDELLAASSLDQSRTQRVRALIATVGP